MVMSIKTIPRPEISGFDVRLHKITPPHDWWDPRQEDLPVVAAYRGINSAQTSWPRGPVTYAESLVNQANPGTYDLVEGNGAVPWAIGAGWTFIAALTKYFDTGIVPGDCWTVMCQFSRAAIPNTEGMLFGLVQGEDAALRCAPNHLLGGIVYANGCSALSSIALKRGNVGLVGQAGYYNGQPDVSFGGWSELPYLSIYIGCNNPASNFITANVESLVIYDDCLTPDQAAAIALAQNQL